MAVQSTDPAVSIRKFRREVEEFRALAADYRRRGWFLLDAEYPRVSILATAPRLRPPAVVTGVLLDYSDYDLRPPSVRLVDPFTLEPYSMKDLPTALLRQVEVEAALPAGIQLPPGAQLAKMIQRQALMQAYGPDDIPFLCLAGVREYHEHPGHSGDAWELHRTSGAGRLIRLIEVIDSYGVKPLSGYNVNLVPQIVGFAENEVPA
ncbi:MAG TPA: putative metal-binding protein [Acidimicrobiales bacterium]|nr:putative metal-binding protein [Acidimicrobiales bacterium]